MGALSQEPRCKKTGFLHLCENKGDDQLRSKPISAFVSATKIVQPIFFLNPKFQASSHLLCLCSPVCFEPGRKSRRQVLSCRFSQTGHSEKQGSRKARSRAIWREYFHWLIAVHSHGNWRDQGSGATVVSCACGFQEPRQIKIQ